MHMLNRSLAAIVAAVMFLASAPVMGGTAYQLSESRPPEHPTAVGVKKFAELVRERTDGRITIDVHDNAALYEDRPAVESAQKGRLAFCRVSAKLLAEQTPILGVLSLPYIYHGEQHVWEVLNGEIGQEIFDEIRETGLVGLVYYDAGARNFYNRRREVSSPNHMRGLRMAVEQNQTMMGLVAALGAQPSPMYFDDIHNGFISELVDGAENTWDVYLSSKHSELARYYTLDRHTRIPDVLCVSKGIWEGISAEDRALIKQAALDSQEVQREAWREYENKARQEIAKGGMVFITEVIDPSEWREVVKPLYGNVELGPKRDEYLKRILGE